jgi:hypothetical protein
MSLHRLAGVLTLAIVASALIGAPLRAQFGSPICNPVILGNPPGTNVSFGQIAAVDYDGDGDQDLFAAVSQGPAIWGFTQVSPGVFATSIVIPTPFFARALRAGDLDLDGDVDLVAGDFGVYAIILNAAGTAQITTVFDPIPGGIELFDFDGDGDLDIWRRTNLIFINDGSGNYTPLVLAPSTAFGDGSYGFRALGDFDADGDRDLITMHGISTPGTGANGLNFLVILDVSINEGGGAFRSAQTIVESSYERPQTLAVGDFDGDGDQDFVIEDNEETNTLRFWSNDGNGRFAGAATLTTAFGELDVPLGIVVADMNGDGADDVMQLIASFTYSYYLMIAGGPCTPALGGGVGFPGQHAIRPQFVDVVGSARPDFVNFASGPFPGSYSLCVSENLMQAPPAAPLVLSVVSGSGQAARMGEPYGQPFVVELRDATGQPVAGQTVTFQTASGSVFPSSATTNAAGRAQTMVTAGAKGGEVAIFAKIGGASCATGYLQEKGLRARLFPPSPFSSTAVDLLTLQYFHDRAGVPLIVAADLAPAASGIISTTYGDIYTSILNPSPTFVALDGLGAFGPADPRVVTAPDWSAVDYVQQTSLPAGTAIVFQVYGVDPALPFPQSVLVSNPQTVVF